MPKSVSYILPEFVYFLSRLTPVSDLVNIRLNHRYPGPLKLELFDQQGRKIRTLVEESYLQGQDVLQVNLRKLSPGTYLLQGSSGAVQDGRTRRQTYRLVKH